MCERPVIALIRIDWSEIDRLVDDCRQFRGIVHEVFAQNLVNTNDRDRRKSLVSQLKAVMIFNLKKKMLSIFMHEQFRWIQYLNTLISKLINGLEEFKQHTKVVSLRKPLKYGRGTRALCMGIRNRAEILKFWMENELREPESFEGKRYMLCRIFPNVYHLQHPSSHRRRRQIYVTLHRHFTSVPKIWEKKDQ